jgi:hypothetical protein
MLSKPHTIMLSNILCSLSHIGKTTFLSIDDDNHMAVMVFAMVYFVAVLHDTDKMDRIVSFLKHFCLCLVRASIVVCAIMLFGHALVVLGTIIRIVGLGAIVSMATTMAFALAFVLLVMAIVALLLLVTYRLLRILLSCITKQLLFRLVGAVILLAGMAVSGVAMVWLATVIHRVGLAKVLLTATAITLVLAIMVLVLSVVVSVVLGVYRLVCRLAKWSTQKRVATPVDGCPPRESIPSTPDCVAVTPEVRCHTESIRFDTKSVCAIPKEGDNKTFQVNFSPYSTVHIVEKWNPGVGQEFNEMVFRNYVEVQMEQQNEAQFVVPVPEEQDQVEELVVLPTVQPPVAPRRSSRLRRKPDRWVPPSSGRSVQLVVPVGSYFQAGVRRSGRIAAARMAVQ